MVKSMTGFGRAECSNEKLKVTTEIKSVNHKYLDMNIKLPKKFNAYESDIRNILKSYMERGKVDVYVSYEMIKGSDSAVKYNEDAAKEYLHYMNVMSENLDLKMDISAPLLARFPEVFTLEDEPCDDEETKELISRSVSEAAKAFVTFREREGEQLAKDLNLKLDELAECVDFIEKKSPLIIEEYKTRLTNKIKEMLDNNNIDENRILTEVAIFADKSCVDEEIVRLKTHIKAVKKELEAKEAVGKKLDFIVQELNREANTTLSKSADLEVTNKAIDIKTIIEKIREQVQNIE